MFGFPSAILRAAEEFLDRAMIGATSRMDGVHRQVDLPGRMQSITSKHDDDIAFVPDVWTNTPAKKPGRR